jgi:iron complex outermembrane receptor protein
MVGSRLGSSSTSDFVRCGCAFGFAVIGEEPSAASAAQEHDVIVVTAQRRPEQLEDVPISITVLSGERLEDLDAADMASLGKVVPGLVMTRTGAFTQPFLRGIGKRSTLGVENGVATYVDGIYLGSSISALLDLRDIDRIEVLHGPQGTLFGRNTTGGVIHVVTRDPVERPSGEAELHVGQYGHVRADAYLTGGTERISGNIAVSLSRNGGYGTNLFSGKKDQGEIDHSLVARSKWIWRPAGSVTVTLAGDYQDIDQDFSQRPVEGFPPIGQPRILGFRDGDQDASNRFQFRYGGISGKAEAEIGSVNFMSLTAARWMHARYSTDLDQGPMALLSGVPTARQHQFSQEFQLQSSASSRVDWTAGLYYIRIRDQYDPTLFHYGGSYAAQLGGRVRQTLSDVGKASSYAGYGQATVPIGGTRLTGGLRYTVEHRSVRANGERLFDNPPFIRPIPGIPFFNEEPLHNEETFREFSWRASLDRNLSDSLMAYFSASRGFQSGGWNLQTPQSPAFGPERLNAYEAGLKFAQPTGRVRANASAFHYDYRDLQVSVFSPLGSVTTNATSADIFGVDLQVAARLSQWTEVSFGAQWLRARFNRFPNGTCTDYSPDAAVPYAPISCDATDNRIPFAPTLKFNVAAHHELDLGSAGTVGLNASLAYNGGYFSEPDNVVKQERFATVDASAEWRPAGRGPTLRVWVSNLTDSEYVDSLVTFPTTGVLQRPAPPRRVGASVAYGF